MENKGLQRWNKTEGNVWRDQKIRNLIGPLNSLSKIWGI